MSDVTIEFYQVWKKFKKGERFDSLRDLFPAMTKRLFSGSLSGDLQEKEFWALNDVSFQVKRGEALGIIGPNGAGKSTILKLLSRILRPNKGNMSVKGRLSALIEVSAGFHPDLTGKENIYLNGAILGMKKKEMDKKIDEIIDFSGVEEFINTPVKRYSSGMYARLGFSVAAHMEPEILLVDEVLSVGDWAFQKKCMDKMNSIIEKGATVIFISHNLRAIADLCEKCILLDHGKIIKHGPTHEVIKHYMNRTFDHGKKPTDKEVYISETCIRDSKGENVRFSPGQKAYLDISISSNVKCNKLAIGIHVSDENYYQIFNTSSERLGYETFSLDAGETRKFTFELSLHLARGEFFFGALVKRYDINKTYDDQFPVATIYICSDKDVRGAANLYPIFSQPT